MLVFVPTATLPVNIVSHRQTYLQLALRMRDLGFCVVIPEITYYPDDRIRQSVVDLRLALSWVGAHISSYGGDPSRIYVMGFGLSSALITLTLVQEAAVLSQTVVDEESDDEENPTRTKTENYLRQLEIYAPQIRLPNLAGVILIAGLSDVVKGYLHEAKLGIEHLSVLRRWAGPKTTQCLLHSPTHILTHTESTFDAAFLPPKFLLIHGGQDTLVPISHSTLLKALLQKAGVPQVELLAYRDLTHLDTLKCLLTPSMGQKSSCGHQMIEAIQKFMTGDNVLVTH